MNLTPEKKPNNVTEVKVELTKDQVIHETNHALEHFKDSVTISGFRKGQAPLSKVKQSVDSTKLQNEVANHIYPKAVEKAIKDLKLVPVMQPRFRITKISDTEFEGVLIFVERPELKLGDYKKTAKEAAKLVQEESKPKIEVAKNMKEAKEKAKENVNKDIGNEPTTEQKVLQKTYDLLAEQTKVDLAEVMIEEEANRMLTNFITYLSRLKIDLQTYLNQQKITIQDIQKDYKKQAEKTLKLEFILSEIAKKEDIKVEQKEIEDVIANTPDEKQKEYLKQPAQQYYIESQLLKNKVANKLVEYAEIKK